MRSPKLEMMSKPEVDRTPRGAAGVEPGLKLAPGTLSDGMIRGIIDDCIVPALVQELLGSRRLTSRRKGRHNGDQSS